MISFIYPFLLPMQEISLIHPNMMKLMHKKFISFFSEGVPFSIFFIFIYENLQKWLFWKKIQGNL